MGTKQINNVSKGFHSLFFLIFTSLLFNVSGDEICYWRISDCPEHLNGETVTVPDNVIAISPTVRSCNIETTIEEMKGKPPSVFFVIDHSSSMSRLGGGNDVDGTRFTVTRDIIDTISQTFPKAEIGLALFRNVLYFDQRNNDIVVPLDNYPVIDSMDYENQSYLPLLRLDSTYTMNGSEMKGIDIIKFFLQTDTVDRTVDITYSPEFESEQGTNINAGFEAALRAMSKSTNEPDNQFLIFISDGEPSTYGQPDSVDINAFAEGLNTPTTFTIYMHNRDTDAPRILHTMTENIQNNGYSEMNQYSEIWTISTSYDVLMSLFREHILQPILRVRSGHAVSMVINDIVSNDRQPDSSFIFGSQFGLNHESNSTEVNIVATYEISDSETGEKDDSTTTTTFTIIRSSSVQTPSMGSLECWNRDLELRFNGSAVSSVNETMNTLEAVFIDSDGQYKTVSIEITNSNPEKQDLLKLPLTRTDNEFSKSFSREINDPDINDAIFQHQLSDSIILTYRNPDNPLDTLRRAYPFSISKTISFPSAAYYDTDANGFVDSVFIAIDGTVITEDLPDLVKKIKLPSYRLLNVDTVKIVPGGLAYIVDCKMNRPSTSVTPDDIIVISSGILSNGGMINGASLSVQDKMAPVLINEAFLSSSNLQTDSLKVTFSEPVEPFNNTNPFLFSKPDGRQYQVTLEPGGKFLDDNTFVAQVRSVQSGFTIVSEDSIWINPSAQIGDTKGNKQTNSSNIRVLLNVKYQPYDLIPSVINNPMNPDFEIPPFIRNLYSEKGLPPPGNGLIIVVEPATDLPPTINIDAKVTIYDVAKNIIQKDLPMVFEPDSQKLYMVWDEDLSINRKGRKVATGTYLALVTITDNHGMVQTKKVPVGVRR